MKALKIIGIVFGVLLLLGIGAVAYVLYKVKRMPDTHDLEAQVDAVARKAVEQAGITVLMLAVVKDGQQYIQGYGTQRELPGFDALFEIGSITKVFTTLTAQALVADGSLSWDDRVFKLLPEGQRPLADDGTTLLNLASHTSGLPRLAPSFLEGDLDECDPYRMLSRDTVFAQYARQEGKSKPGGTADYSNWGMGLLGHLLELRMDTSYEALVRQRLLTPLGMEQTWITADDSTLNRLVIGYDMEGEATCPWEFGALGGAGAFRSSIVDMARFLEAAVEQRSIPGIDWEASFRKRSSYTGGGVGLGWHIDGLQGALFGIPRILWHNGGTGGFSSYIGLAPEKGFGVVVLAARSGTNATVDKLGFDVLMRANHISFAGGDRGR